MDDYDTSYDFKKTIILRRILAERLLKLYSFLEVVVVEEYYACTFDIPS